VTHRLTVLGPRFLMMGWGVAVGIVCLRSQRSL
jgi:hypothetical protein